jgi:hypothetical protein
MYAVFIKPPAVFETLHFFLAALYKNFCIKCTGAGLYACFLFPPPPLSVPKVLGHFLKVLAQKKMVFRLFLEVFCQKKKVLGHFLKVLAQKKKVLGHFLKVLGQFIAGFCLRCQEFNRRSTVFCCTQERGCYLYSCRTQFDIIFSPSSFISALLLVSRTMIITSAV